jgi:hypothetical protein
MFVLRGADWKIARQGRHLAHLWLVTRWAAPRRHGGPVAGNKWRRRRLKRRDLRKKMDRVAKSRLM